MSVWSRFFKKGSEESDELSAKKGKLTRIIFAGIKPLFFVVMGAIIVFWGIRNKPEWFGIKNSSLVNSQTEVQRLVEEVGKIIELPTGETPTIATVTDLEKVKNQKFFEKAQNGDKVLIYSNAKKAFLYRPSERKIIEVGVVNVQKQPEKEEVSPTPTVTSFPTLPPTWVPTSTPNPTPTPTASEGQ